MRWTSGSPMGRSRKRKREDNVRDKQEDKPSDIDELNKHVAKVLGVGASNEDAKQEDHSQGAKP